MSSTASTPRRARPVTVERCSRQVRAAGTSQYQQELLTIAPQAADKYVRGHGTCLLACQPDNPHDPNAVGIAIAGRHVGYLPRGEAAAYQPVFAALACQGINAIRCAVTITGGGPSTETLGARVYLPKAGVMLDHLAAAPESGQG